MTVLSVMTESLSAHHTCGPNYGWGTLYNKQTVRSSPWLLRGHRPLLCLHLLDPCVCRTGGLHIQTDDVLFSLSGAVVRVVLPVFLFLLSLLFIYFLQ